MKIVKNSEIIHLVDIGNTSATYGLAQNGKIIKTESLNPCDTPERIINQSKSGRNLSQKIIISSVVPKITEKLISAFNAYGSFDTIVLGQDLQIPLKTNYKNVSKLGVDRKINAYGAISSHKTPSIILDFGTALTCDLVSEKGVFLGGLIIPGPATSLKSLLSNTAMLPKLFSLKKTPAKAYGQSTDECIQHGVIQAYAAMTDGLIAKLSKEFKRKPHVIITGGFSSFIGKIICSKAEINPAHTLESMLKIYLSQKKS
jgi:type III pantothenate kinase